MGNRGKMLLMVQAIEKQHTAVVLLYLILGILLFSVTFMILQEPYIRYISRISEAVQNISEGNLNTVIDVIGDDEFSSMAANLNHMAADIKKLMEKERESERTKNELITNVAHDLRTPLTSIIGYLELLAGNQQVPADMQHKYIEIAYGKSRRLQKLIEDLFGFTKLNCGKIAMHVGQIDIVKLLGQLVEEADELPLIFNKFYRVEQSRSSSTGGTGLGLAIAKEIVDMHGGTISVASDLNGTVFTVKLQVDFDVDKENFGHKNED